MKICIDPGHGGYDPGAVGPSGVQEKDVTLAVSKLLAAQLQAAGVEVLLTRDSDAGPWDSNSDLQKRCDIANQFGADLFISIHANAAANPSAVGTETYCYKFGGQGEQLAHAIQEQLVAALGRPDRGIKTANYYVLKRTNMVAVLAELAFISNPGEESLLVTPSCQEQAAQAIAQGIGNLYGFTVQQGASAVVVDPNAVRVIFRGQQMPDGTELNDTTFVPLRALCEAAGFTLRVDWPNRTVYVD